MRAAILFVLALSACSGPSADPGLDALVLVRGATFYRAAAPRAGLGAPITSAAFIRSSVVSGAAAGLSGTTPFGTGAIVIAAHGDVGYWVVRPGVVDPLFPDQLDFSASVLLGADVQAELAIDFFAVSTEGVVGPATTLSLTPELRTIPTGKVVVSLDWDTQSDLDLRVVDPSGAEIWSKKISSYVRPAPPAMAGPDDFRAGGILDFDSNAACVIDGRRQENIVWQTTAPSGAYLVRVDTYSLCGQTAARWKLRALVDGTVVSEAHGTSLPNDTRFDHGPGAGLFVRSFMIPNN